MAAPAQIQVEGIKEVRRALKGYETETEWKPALKGAYGNVARMVADKVRSRAAGSRMGSVARGSIQGKGTTTYAGIVAYKGVPWGPGHEFGSIRYRQFPPKKIGGYHIYPTIGEDRDEIGEMFLEELDRAFSSDFG